MQPHSINMTNFDMQGFIIVNTQIINNNILFSILSARFSNILYNRLILNVVNI